MNRRSPVLLKISYLIFTFGIFLVGLEYILENFFRKSLCTASSCLIAKELLLLEKNYLLLIALFFYFFLILLLFFYQKTEGTFFRNLIFWLLTAGLIGDTYLIAFLSLQIKEPCWFCLTVFLITLSGTISVFLYLKKEAISSLQFLLALIFGMFSLGLGLYFSSSSTLISTESDVKNATLILIYSNHCPACQKVITESEKLGLKIKKIPLKDAFPLLKTLNIKNLPCLLEVKEAKVEIFVGFEAVKERLNLEATTNPCYENPQEGGLCAIP